MSLHAPFDENACLSAVVYLTRRLENPSKHTITHLLYLAEKKHLEAYGRFICGDTYIAMKHGPVPSIVFDMLKIVSGEREFDPRVQLGARFRQALSYEGLHRYQATEDADLDALSKSDVECLDAVLEDYGHMNFPQLREATHDEAYLSTRSDRPDRPIPVDRIARLFPDGDELIDHLRDPHPG